MQPRADGPGLVVSLEATRFSATLLHLKKTLLEKLQEIITKGEKDAKSPEVAAASLNEKYMNQSGYKLGASFTWRDGPYQGQLSHPVTWPEVGCVFIMCERKSSYEFMKHLKAKLIVIPKQSVV